MRSLKFTTTALGVPCNPETRRPEWKRRDVAFAATSLVLRMYRTRGSKSTAGCPSWVLLHLIDSDRLSALTMSTISPISIINVDLGAVRSGEIRSCSDGSKVSAILIALGNGMPLNEPADMQRPVPLIALTEGRYRVCEEGAAFLRSIEGEIAVLACAGRYRTGKSFLLNRGILGEGPGGGFPTASSTNACTKGIWIMPRLHRPNALAIPALILDTEGTASLEATAEADAKLLSIALLLSSLFLFNSLGSLDETSLSDLATMASLATSLKADQAWDAPDLVWVLRDFGLDLESPTGEKWTAGQYFEHALGGHAAKGDTREMLRHAFASRELVTLVRPMVEEAELRRLNDLPLSAMRPEFNYQLTLLRELVAKKLVAKTIGGTPVNGASLLLLASQAVEATNANTVPSVCDTFNYLMQARSAAFVRDAEATLAEEYAAIKVPTREMPVFTPRAPDFLRHAPSYAQGCAESLEAFGKECRRGSAMRNERAAEAWVVQATSSLQCGSSTFAERFSEAVSVLPGRIDEAGITFHYACTERTEQELAARELENRTLEKEIECACLARNECVQEYSALQAAVQSASEESISAIQRAEPNDVAFTELRELYAALRAEMSELLEVPPAAGVIHEGPTPQNYHQEIVQKLAASAKEAEQCRGRSVHAEALVAHWETAAREEVELERMHVQESHAEMVELVEAAAASERREEDRAKHTVREIGAELYAEEKVARKEHEGNVTATERCALLSRAHQEDRAARDVAVAQQLALHARQAQQAHEERNAALRFSQQRQLKDEHALIRCEFSEETLRKRVCTTENVEERAYKYQRAMCESEAASLQANARSEALTGHVRDLNERLAEVTAVGSARIHESHAEMMGQQRMIARLELQLAARPA